MALDTLSWDEATATLVLPEELNLQNMPVWLKKNQALQLPVKRLDFSRLQCSDSSILALLVYWQSHLSESEDARIEVIHFPKQLKPLIELYSLSDLLIDSGL